MFVDRTLLRHVNGEATVQEAAMAKYSATELFSEAADTCLQLHGGYGYTTEYPISEYWTDSRVNRIYAARTRS